MKGRDSRAEHAAEAARLAGRIQHTLISNVLTIGLWEAHVAECVRRTAEALRNSGVRVASFVDFPYGTMMSAGKAYQAGQLVAEGTDEIDLMPNVGFLLSGMEREYFDDVRGVVQAAGKVPVKIMLELPLLDEHQRERAVALSVDAGVAYLKNASGGAVGVATPEDIRFLRTIAPRHVGVKASGGIKTAEQVHKLLEAGADLVGTSSSVKIMQEILNRKDAVPEHDPSQY